MLSLDAVLRSVAQICFMVVIPKRLNWRLQASLVFSLSIYREEAVHPPDRRVVVVSVFRGGDSSLPETESAVAGGANVPVSHGREELREPRSLEDERSE